MILKAIWEKRESEMKPFEQLFVNENKSHLKPGSSARNLTVTEMLAIWSSSFERELVLKADNKRLMSMQKALIDNNQSGILIIDSNGIVVELNHTAEDILGQKVHTILGAHVQKIPGISKYIMEVLDDGKIFEKIHLVIENKLAQTCLLDVFPLYDENGKLVGAIAQLHDIAEAYRIHEKFNYLSNHDEPTGLPNRKFLTTKLTNLIEVNKSNQGSLAVIHFGLDRFKLVNDTLGYTNGDQVLKKIVQRLEISLKPTEFIARIGGDEFLVIAPCENDEEVLQIGERFRSVFNEPFVMKGYEFHITASIGIAMYPDDSTTSEGVIFNADTAMTYAKKRGKNQVVYYSSKLDYDSQEKVLLEASFRKAIASDELVLYYQPKIDIKTGLISGVEALVRWQHSERGLIPPDEFIPMAEETGLISRLDEWVLREACEQNKKWQNAGAPPITVAVNLSSAQFSSHKLIGLVEATLKETGLKPEYLELEITETMAMDVDHAIPTLKQLSALGVKISLDDFGTGYSSMNYLTKFAIDRLKIDRSFIWNIEKGGSDSNIVITIIRMAHSLGLKVIAEGVEDVKQLEFLDEHGCDEVQGFYYSKPLPAVEIKNKYLKINS